MLHAIFNLLSKKNNDKDSVPQTFRMGSTTEAQPFQQNTAVSLFVRFTLQRQRLYVWQMSHSFRPFQFFTRKILYPHYLSPVACTPRKVIRHVTSQFDVREVEMDMQTSRLNAAPCRQVHRTADKTHRSKRPRENDDRPYSWWQTVLLKASAESVNFSSTQAVESK